MLQHQNLWQEISEYNIIVSEAHSATLKLKYCIDPRMERPKELRSYLEGMTVNIGDTVQMPADSPFTGAGIFYNDMHQLEVVDTEPTGRVRITEHTKILMACGDE